MEVLLNKESNVENIPGEMYRERTDNMLNSSVEDNTVFDFSRETTDSVFGSSSKQSKVEAAADVHNLESKCQES